jgi:outer membrane protein
VESSFPVRASKSDRYVLGRLVFHLGVLVLFTIGPIASEPAEIPKRDLRLEEFLQLVLQRNENLQLRALEYQITQKRLKAERGVFEPELVLGYDRVENRRENSAEQRRSSGVAIFEEKNNVYSTGIEGLVPTGARLRFGYTLRDMRNNLQDPPLGTIFTNFPGREYQSFLGVTVTQPLLKNAWFSSSMANIRLASLAGEVAFQEYRRQLMLLVTTAEASYWNLYLEQEQSRLLTDSVKLAEDLARDNEERFRLGQGSELEVLEARAGVALRKTKLAEAEQKYFETSAQLAGLMSELVRDSMPLVRANNPPEGQAVPEFQESAREALGSNPDYLGQLKKLHQEKIRLAYARNQRLPQLDLKGSYGLNGLGPDVGSSWEDISREDFISWSAGVELRIPLGGGIKTRNELSLAKLRQEQGLLLLQDIENQMLNSITTTLRKLRSSDESVRDYERIVAFNQELLATERQRLEAGRTNSRRILEVDAALFESKNAVVEAKVLRERARLELDLVQGTVLKNRSLEFSRKDLEEKTLSQLRAAGITPEQFQKAIKDETAPPPKRSIPLPRPPTKQP